MNKIGLFQVVDLDQRKWRGCSRCHISLSTEWTSKFKEDFLLLSIVLLEAFDIIYSAFTCKNLGHRFLISLMLDFQLTNSGSCTLFNKLLCSLP